MEYSIRAFNRQDIADLARAANHADVADRLTDEFPYPYLFEDAARFVKTALSDATSGSIIRAICVDDRVVGCISLTRGNGSYGHTAELGYFIDPAYQGRGIAASAVRKMCSEALDGTDIVRIWARPMADNHASIRVLEKCGFVREGTACSGVRKNGQIKDSEIFALVADRRNSTDAPCQS